MDGIEFLKKIRSSGNPIPFIIFTGQEREEAVMEAISNGADFCLRKDGSLETQFFELAHKIRIAIEHQRTLEKILSLNRLYSVLSASNKAIVHLRTKDGFFSEICRILVETGGISHGVDWPRRPGIPDHPARCFGRAYQWVLRHPAYFNRRCPFRTRADRHGIPRREIFFLKRYRIRSPHGAVAGKRPEARVPGKCCLPVCPGNKKCRCPDHLRPGHRVL